MEGTVDESTCHVIILHDLKVQGQFMAICITFSEGMDIIYQRPVKYIITRMMWSF